ncbi:MAG: hypothetical protein IT168_28490 [Bryobacterales bacterium]|nr:hypothetical protein [Bryobacterales bacterium]
MKRFLLYSALAATVVLLALVVAGWVLSRRFEPFLREQTVAYLSERLASDVELQSIDVGMPLNSPLEILLRKGKGANVHVSGRGLALRFRGNEDLPPMIRIRRFAFQVDLQSLWFQPAYVGTVKLEGLEIHVPPKGRRPRIKTGSAEGSGKKPPKVFIRQIRADGTKLVIIPAKPGKAPLQFDIHQLTLNGTESALGFDYDAVLTNAKPPGLIDTKGHFGPWNAEEPGDTPISGKYDFSKADLGVFKGIAGTLASTGTFAGQLNRLVVNGETRVPDFRLKSVNHPVPLTTQFHAIVDGTNGDTELQPVAARLGQTQFLTRGGVIRYEGTRGKTVALDVKLTQGRVEDMLRLAMKGPRPILRGGIQLTMKFALPPGQGEIADRLKIRGQFALLDARFTSTTVQDKIDSLSRRGQGRPKDHGIDEVPSRLAGSFNLANGVIDFDRLRFTVPGAAVSLAGHYTFASEEMNFRGDLKLDAKVSQTMSGWKRWALKPVDPFFAKEGAGTFLKIKVDGTRDNPQFGRDKGT